MSSIQKVSLSLLIAIVLAALFAFFAYTGLFAIFETRFYVNNVEKKIELTIQETKSSWKKWFDQTTASLESLSRSPYLISAFKVNQSRGDILLREKNLQDLISTTDIRSIRLADTEKRLHFSTRSQDLVKNEAGKIQYLAKEAILGFIPWDNLVFTEQSQFKYFYNFNDQEVIVSLSVVDEKNIFWGTLIAYVDLKPLLIKVLQDQSQVSKKGRLISASRYIFNEPYGTDLVEVLNSSWGIQGTKIISEQGKSFYTTFFEIDSSLTGAMVTPYEELIMPDALKIILVILFFLTLFLTAFLVLNIRHDEIVVLSKRIKRLQLSLLENYLETKNTMDEERWQMELRSRRDEVHQYIKRGLGKRKSKRPEVEELVDRGWEEILGILGAKNEKIANANIDFKKLENMMQKVLDNWQTGNPVMQTSFSGKKGTTSKQSAKNTAKQPVTLQAVQKIEQMPEELEELGDDDAVEALEELGDADVDDAEAVEELEDVAEAEEVEELGDADAVEALEELGDADVDDAEAVEELEDVAEAEEVEELGDADAVEALEELDDADVGEAEAVEELEDVAEAEEVEELGDADAVEALEELDDADVGEAEAVEELEDVAEAEEVEELGDADTVEALEELDDADVGEAEAEEVEELDDADAEEALEELESEATALDLSLPVYDTNIPDNEIPDLMPALLESEKVIDAVVMPLQMNVHGHERHNFSLTNHAIETLGKAELFDEFKTHMKGAVEIVGFASLQTNATLEWEFQESTEGVIQIPEKIFGSNADSLAWMGLGEATLVHAVPQDAPDVERRSFYCTDAVLSRNIEILASGIDFELFVKNFRPDESGKIKAMYAFSKLFQAESALLGKFTESGFEIERKIGVQEACGDTFAYAVESVVFDDLIQVPVLCVIKDTKIFMNLFSSKCHDLTSYATLVVLPVMYAQDQYYMLLAYSTAISLHQFVQDHLKTLVEA